MTNQCHFWKSTNISYKSVLDAVKNKKTTWLDYESEFIPLIKQRGIKEYFAKMYRKYDNGY